MPAVIVYKYGEAIPAIFQAGSDAKLLEKLRTVSFAPELPNVAAAKEWIATLDLPSGWFDSLQEMLAYTEQVKRAKPATAQEFVAARELLGMSRADFMAEIGFAGNSNTRHKLGWEFENGKKELGIDKSLRMRALVASAKAKQALEG